MTLIVGVYFVQQFSLERHVCVYVCLTKKKSKQARDWIPFPEIYETEEYCRRKSEITIVIRRKCPDEL